MALRHAAVVVVADDPSYPVGSDEWNADHVLVGGTDTRVLFNDAGAIGEDAGLTYNKTSDLLMVAGPAASTGGIAIQTGGGGGHDGNTLLLDIGGGTENGLISAGTVIRLNQSDLGANTGGYTGFGMALDTGVAANTNSIELEGFYVALDQTRSGTSTASRLTGFHALIQAAAIGFGGNITTAEGFRAGSPAGGQTAVITNFIGFHALDVSGESTNAYGLKVENQAAAGAFAIHTGVGLVQLGTLTASKPVFTDASKNLVSTGTLGGDQGGTGLAVYAVGDLLYASGATTLSKLADVATGSLLASGGVTTAPAWSSSPTLTGLTLSGLTASRPVATNGSNALVSGGLTMEKSILNGLPDTTGRCFWESYVVKATNDNFGMDVLIFNQPSTQTHGLYGQFRVPPDYVAGAAIIVIWTATATSGNCKFQFAYRTVGGDDTTSMDQATFEETVTATDVAPTAAHRRLTLTISPTAANFTAGETVEFYLTRTDAASSEMAAAAIVFDALFQYTN